MLTLPLFRDLLYRIIPPGMKRVALKDPDEAQKETSAEPLLFERLHHVAGTGRVEPACRGDVGRYAQPVKPEHENGNSRHPLKALVVSVPSSRLTASKREAGRHFHHPHGIVGGPRKQVFVQPEELSRQSLDPVPLHCSLYLPAHHDAEPCDGKVVRFILRALE